MPQVKEAGLNLELNFTEMCELKRKGKKEKQRQLKTKTGEDGEKGRKILEPFKFFLFSPTFLLLEPLGK